MSGPLRVPPRHNVGRLSGAEVQLPQQVVPARLLEASADAQHYVESFLRIEAVGIAHDVLEPKPPGWLERPHSARYPPCTTKLMADPPPSSSALLLGGSGPPPSSSAL